MDNIIETKSNKQTNFNFNQVACDLVQGFVNELMLEQAKSICEDLGTTLNGTRERNLKLSFGEITLSIPKLRQGNYFPQELIKRWSRCDTALSSIVCEMWSQGISTRKIDLITKKLGITSIEKSEVSRFSKTLDAEVKQLIERDLSWTEWPYLWIDATFFHCREADCPRMVAFAVAIAANKEGKRQVVGFKCIDVESKLSWRDFLLNLKSRGLNGVQLVISDEHAGLVEAVREVMLGAAHQRCIAHLEKNVIDKAKRKNYGMAAVKALKFCFKESKPGLVRAGYRRACDLLAKYDKDDAAYLAKAEDFALAYLNFPREHSKWIKTNNICERANEELKRRSKVVGVFPSRESITRLIGARCCDLNDLWLSERWFVERGSLASLCYEAADYRTDSIEEKGFCKQIEIEFEKERLAA